jgi:hypothetical protein
MISGKAKVRPMVLTSHNVQTAMIKAQIGRVPEVDRTPKQKQFLIDAQQQERGIITVHDIHEARSAQEQAAKDTSKTQAVNAVEVKRESKGAKSGKKKSA